MPMRDGLAFVHHALIGVGVRERVRIGVAGQIVTAFDMARALALGADWCNSARGFMFALGCIQSQSCHTDHCPTGVATQDASRARALVVSDKALRVANFHRATLMALAELAGRRRARSSERLRAGAFLPAHLAPRRRDFRRAVSGAGARLLSRRRDRRALRRRLAPRARRIRFTRPRRDQAENGGRAAVGAPAHVTCFTCSYPPGRCSRAHSSS